MQADLCVYGGTAAGVVAAVAAARAGRSAVLVEPGRHAGGVTSGGLGFTDVGNEAAVGGIAREFYRRVGTRYVGKKLAAGQNTAARSADGATWVFEPHVAEDVCREMLAEAKVPVLYEHRLAGAEMRRGRLARVELERVPAGPFNEPGTEVHEHVPVTAAMYLDCTYEGDLMAAAGVTHTVGRESARQYGEALNGVVDEAARHQFPVRVDPYVRPGDAGSGLLPLVQAGDGGRVGDGDGRVQAYTFRLCLTNVADRLPIPVPDGYDAGRYELLGRYVEALAAAGKLPRLNGTLLKISPLTAGKTDVNNQGAISTDDVGMADAYPAAGYADRARMWRDHLSYVHGLLHFLRTDGRVPEGVRREMSAWGLCRDEFADTAGWPHALYVREGRRMVSDYVVTQAVCEHATTADDPVALATYRMDSHPCQRVARDGAAYNEGNLPVRPQSPYPIAYRAIVPRRGECGNLLVPVCLSASHVAYGSIRMEPVFMALAHAAAVAADLAIGRRCDVQDVPYAGLRDGLLKAGQVLAMPAKRR